MLRYTQIILPWGNLGISLKKTFKSFSGSKKPFHCHETGIPRTNVVFLKKGSISYPATRRYIAYKLCCQMLHDFACAASTPNARPAASCLFLVQIRFRFGARPTLTTPRLSGGWKQLAEAGTWLIKKNTICKECFTAPKLPHDPNVCDSFTKGLKDEIFGCEAQSSLLHNIVICIIGSL